MEIHSKYELSLLSHIFRYTLYGFYISVCLVPHSRTLPSPSTNILSESFKVVRRWAMVKTVLYLNLVAITFWMSSSFLTSMLAVASSIRMILLFLRKARQMHRSCFSPTDRFSLLILASIPPFYCTISSRLHSLTISISSSSE